MIPHPAPRRGLFIALEGGEGAGKSRLQASLGERLAASGRSPRRVFDEIVLTREPGGTPLGEAIRALVLAQQALDNALAELLLFEAARAQLMADVIWPALDRNAIVICDRFAASSVAYQGYGRELGRREVDAANDIATGGLRPDLTLLLDLPPAVGLARRAGDGVADHFDAAELAFHERVRTGYHDLARTSAGWVVVDAEAAFEVVLAAALDAIEPLLGGGAA